MSSSSSTSHLFEPIAVGPVTLQHRAVLAPLTRYKASKEHVPFLPLVKDYYTQRGSRPGTLLISEGVFIAPQAGGYSNVSGIWNKEQIAAWKEVTTSVHAQGSHIFMQLWALGRGALPAVLREENPAFDLVSASDVPIPGREGDVPRALSTAEVQEYVGLYAQAAKNAREAGFDGVELHNANGYFIDQFLQDVSNRRTDQYGGSIENRARLTLEIVDAVSSAIGADRTAIRFSPWSLFQGMKMADPLPTFSYVISELAKRHPDLAYLHLVEPRISGSATVDEETPEESNDPLAALWSPRPLVVAGALTREKALKATEKDGVLVCFGRHYISNPDLPDRLEKNIPFTPYDRNLFYLQGEDSPRGYTDYPTAQ
ncbi:unnamed protein product [Mycena citricolor]|uniref:NADH:flavin oxidoreductase/NADH oxidase N-terminal domain-containing protein n=1 Tax=Mycena citricolor TaxID=2018698 RepID=A0AAD2K877_9AGAR|nr:unnamed protein product [Mycena citricolor]